MTDLSVRPDSAAEQIDTPTPHGPVGTPELALVAGPGAVLGAASSAAPASPALAPRSLAPQSLAPLPGRPPVDVLFDDAVTATASYRERRVAPRGTGYLPYRYAVAGLLTIGSQVPLHELDFFLEPSLGKDLDIEIRVGKVGRGVPRGRARLLRFDGPAGVRYEEHLGRLAANFSIDLGDRIHVTVSSLLARSPHVAYTNVIEALLRFVIASKGRMLLHSACVEIDGRGVLLSARTDTGKTGTVLRLLREKNARFLSDDMTIIASDGTAYCFPKPLTISSHTLRAVDPGDLSRAEWLRLSVQSRIHSKGGRGIGLRMGNVNLPIMSANALTQIVVPPPKYRADRLVPCERQDQVEVSDIFIIERGHPALTGVPIDRALEELLENTDDAYGFPPFRYLAPVLVIGGEMEAELRARERALLTSVLERTRVRRMTSDDFDWADRIPTALGD